MSESGELAIPVSGQLVVPAATPAKVKEALDKFIELRDFLLDEDDWQLITVKKKQEDGSSKWMPEKFPKKSGRCKLDLAFNVSQEFVKSERIVLDSENFGVLVIMKAKAPNGREAVGDGYCDSIEKAGHKFHDLFAIAKTRASNRASFDLYGLGHVSAEEMEGTSKGHGSPPPKPATPESGEVVKMFDKDAQDWCKEHGCSIADLEPYLYRTGTLKTDNKFGGKKGDTWKLYWVPVEIHRNGIVLDTEAELLDDVEEAPLKGEPFPIEPEDTGAMGTIDPADMEYVQLGRAIDAMCAGTTTKEAWAKMHGFIWGESINRSQLPQIYTDIEKGKRNQ